MHSQKLAMLVEQVSMSHLTNYEDRAAAARENAQQASRHEAQQWDEGKPF